MRAVVPVSLLLVLALSSCGGDPTSATDTSATADTPGDPTDTTVDGSSPDLTAEVVDVAPVDLADSTTDAEPEPEPELDATEMPEDPLADSDPDVSPDPAPDMGSDTERDTDAGSGAEWFNQAAVAGLHDDGPAFGRGAAWIDVDGDGWEDLWQTDSVFGTPEHTSRLYRNLRNGTFKAISLGLDQSVPAEMWAGIWGDFDNDGDPDLFVINGGFTNDAACDLYRNDLATVGTFTRVTAAAGVLPLQGHWWGAAWADIDNDGFLDLVVTAVNGPILLYRNQGDGTFDEDSDGSGLSAHEPDRRNPVWLDYDRDGDPDLYVAGMTGHHLWRNDGGAGFVEVTDVAFARQPDTVFSAAAEDFDQDGWDDLYLGRWDEQDYVMLNAHDGTFARHGREAGLDMATSPDPSENTMGLQVGDLNDDGWPDVLIGTGEPSDAYAPLVYCNTGAVFTRCGDDFAAGHPPSRHHGIALADPDHDGDTDVFWNLGGPAYIPFTADYSAYYVREPAVAPSTAVVHLVGHESNRDAVGARMEVVGSETHYYTVRSFQGFQSRNSDWIVVSLGAAEAGTVEIGWPSGQTSRTVLARGDRVTLVEPL